MLLSKLAGFEEMYDVSRHGQSQSRPFLRAKLHDSTQAQSILSCVQHDTAQLMTISETPSLLPSAGDLTQMDRARHLASSCRIAVPRGTAIQSLTCNSPCT